MNRAREPRDAGFTLIELLIVIVILGVLATVVVFAVGGIVDRGDASAVSADERTIVGAEESYHALHGAYAPEAELVSAGLLREHSSLHDVTIAVDGSTYAVTAVGSGGGGGPATTTAPPPVTEPPPTVAPPPTTPPTTAPTGPVATTYGGYGGQALGTGSRTLVIIGTGSGASATLFGNLQATPLVDARVVWLDAGDVTETADVDAIIASGADYLVAAQSVPIRHTSTGANTYVGAYMATFLDWPTDFWWMQSQGIPSTAQLQSRL